MEQVQIVVKNLQSSVKKHLIAQPLATFQQLYASGIQVEDATRLGILDRAIEPSVNRPPRKFGNNPISNPQSSSHSKEVNAIDTQVLQNLNPGQRTQQRIFTPLNMSLSEALDRLVAAKHLTLLQPTPRPAILPKNHDPS